MYYRKAVTYYFYCVRHQWHVTHFRRELAVYHKILVNFMPPHREKPRICTWFEYVFLFLAAALFHNNDFPLRHLLPEYQIIYMFFYEFSIFRGKYRHNPDTPYSSSVHLICLHHDFTYEPHSLPFTSIFICCRIHGKENCPDKFLHLNRFLSCLYIRDW